MAYTINKSNGTILTVVEDGTIDNTTDLQLVGKNFAGYGEIQNENFVFLLENFADATPPARPVGGQIWFDSDTSKLKFYDGSKFRTTGGAEIGANAPAGLTEGDFWWDTGNEQLYAYNGTDFVLIGPQDAGEGITQMQSRTIVDTQGISHSVIVSVLNDSVVHVISNEEFTIAPGSENEIPGFDRIKKGITLVNTLLSTGGVTSTNHIFWGTASNSLKLGGDDESQFVRKGAADFDSLVSFADIGFAVGDSNDLRVLIENDNQAVFANEVGNVISLKTKDNVGNLKNSLRILSNGILPGLQADGITTEVVDIGSEDAKFVNVYADNFNGLAQRTSAIVVNGNDRFGDISATSNSVAVRDATGNLKANIFDGIALKAKYADLAEKYTTKETLLPGTIVSVCEHEDHEICEAELDDIVIGVVSTNPAFVMNEASTGQPIALEGRVPVRVIGKVTKGQSVKLDYKGVGSVHSKGALIGIALETNNDENEKLVECVLKV
jgi:hypothetical protein